MALLLLLAAGGLSGCQKDVLPDFSGLREWVSSVVRGDNGENLGTYQCVELTVQDLALDSQGKWLRLEEDGVATLCLAGVEETGSWSLEGDAFSVAVDGETAGTGTLRDGVLTAELRGMTGVFVREGAALPDEDGGEEAQTAGQDAQAEEEAEPPVTTFACYGGLYYIDYPVGRFQPGPQGSADLWAEDGTQLWFSRLATQELVDTWLAGFAEKGAGQQYLSYEGHSWTVNGSPAQSIVYQDQEGWHAEAILSFGNDRGTSDLPMYAAYVVISGREREAVWNGTIRDILNSLRLGGQEEGATE